MRDGKITSFSLIYVCPSNNTKLYFNIGERVSASRSVQKIGVTHFLSVFYFLFLFLLVFNLFVKLGDEYALSLDKPKKLMNRKIILCVCVWVTPQFTNPNQLNFSMITAVEYDWISFYFIFFVLNFIQLVDFAFVIQSWFLLERNIDWWWFSWFKLIVLSSQSVRII